MRTLLIMEARLRSSAVYQAFDTKDAPASPQKEDGPRDNKERALPLMTSADLSLNKRHLLRQVLANTGNVCYVNSILRTWAWSLDGLDTPTMRGHLESLYSILTEGPEALSLTEHPTFVEFAADWMRMHEQQDAGDFLGYVMTKAQATNFTCITRSVFEQDLVGNTRID